MRRPHDKEITKANYVEWQADTVPLEPGEYTVKGHYNFDRSVQTGNPGQRTYEFTPSAKQLFNIAFSGKLEATATFTVKP